MVRGSRHNRTIQFKNLYPKTGGGEDINLCFQFKEWYTKKQGNQRVVVGVPGATAHRLWWKDGRVCYDHIKRRLSLYLRMAGEMLLVIPQLG
mmetsp:Transcript_9516/g.15829  ORF Transcript_9516/g.15829 Transcript_9516/m.15829 type:complete len:92 (-) Transcript_9516:344-619(-)